MSRYPPVSPSIDCLSVSIEALPSFNICQGVCVACPCVLLIMFMDFVFRFGVLDFSALPN